MSEICHNFRSFTPHCQQSNTEEYCQRNSTHLLKCVYSKNQAKHSKIISILCGTVDKYTREKAKQDSIFGLFECYLVTIWWPMVSWRLAEGYSQTCSVNVQKTFHYNVLGTVICWCYPGYCPACRTTLVATRFRVAVICPIIQVPHSIRVFFYFVWFVFINHIFNFIVNYVPIVTFWIFTCHKIWILSIMFCFIWSYWIIYFLACLEVSWRVVS